MPRVAIVIGALLAGLLTIPYAPQVATADSSCPTAAGAYAGGAGTQASPWQISTKEQLQRLRDDSITGWDDSFILTANINMGGCTWTSVIGDPGVAQFTGMIDGAGHVISGLTVSRTGSAPTVYAGLVGYLGPGGVITRLGFTGSVMATTTNANVQIFAGGLVGRTLTGATISYSYASGAVTATMVGGGSPQAYVGGLVGDVNGGTITNSFATGSLTVLSSGGMLFVGGLVGKTAPSVNASVSKSYSTGSVVGLGGTPGYLGGFVGMRGGTDLASDNFWDTTSSGTSTGVGSGSTTGIAGKTTTQMQAFSTYDDSGWAITNGWDTFSLVSTPNRVWGICAGVGRAYLLWQYAASPCPSTPSAPTISSITPGGTTASVAFTVDDTGNAALTRLDFAYDDTTAVDFTTNTVASPATLTGLTLNTTYTVYMRVKNSTYTGPWSAPSTFMTLRTPGAPSISSVAPGLTSAQVAFTADDSGGSAITRLEFALDDTVAVDDSTTTLASPYSLGNLASGTTYAVYVRAVNAQGAGPWSSPVAFTTLAPPEPPPPSPATPPRDVRATAGEGSLTATWRAPASEGSYPVSHYQAATSPGGRTCLTASTTCTIEGLTPGIAYTVTVQALSGAGWSPSSAPSNAVIPRPTVERSLAITGTRGSGAERSLIRVRGTSTGLAGERATLWLTVGDRPATPALTTVTIAADGTFAWSRKLNRAAVIYATAPGVRSNAIRLPPAR